MPVTFHSAPSFFSAWSTRSNFWLFPGHVSTNCVAIRSTLRQIKNTKTRTKRLGLERASDTTLERASDATHFPGHVTTRTMKDSYKRERERERERETERDRERERDRETEREGETETETETDRDRQTETETEDEFIYKYDKNLF